MELDVSGLSKSFDGGRRPVLSNVSFQVPRGQAAALIGSNGAGKSTLLRCCLRLVEPDAGSVRLWGTEVRRLGRRALRRMRSDVGFVFQRHNLVGRLSVLSNVIHGALGSGWGLTCCCQSLAPRRLREQAMHCLEQVGSSHLARQRVDTLSGGESQRVAIARALMQRPRMLMADEPVASLDPQVGEEIMSLLLELVRSRSLTLLFSSHHLGHACKYSDRVLVLRAGRLVLDVPSQGLDAESLRKVYG